MTRTYIVATIVAALVVPMAGAKGGIILPGIQGAVSQSGAGVEGVTIRLFKDDGDGIFNPGTDMQVGPDVTTASGGSYAFESLNPDVGYFVERPTQMVGGSSLPGEVSGLLQPGAPVLVIDAFDNNQGVKASPSTPIATSTLNDPMANTLGGERDLYVRLVSGIGEVELRSNAFGVAILQYDNTSGVVGHGVITWDGPDMSASPTPSLGLGDVDLTQGGAEGISFYLGIDATGAGDTARIRIFDESNTEYSEGVVSIPVTDGTATSYTYVAFDDFVGSVSPSKVNAIQLILGQGARSVDAQFDTIATIAPVQQDFELVPEPSSLTLAAASALGLLWGCRRTHRRGH